uniref:Copia protein n=1 Tax=Tanacetum cinerariifolium TaxID=118510 RepID=A0A6L2KHE2_TANCI|nr:copia protein [Tanacetum cinerariifolium]
MFFMNNVNDMILKIKQNEKNFQTIFKNIERKIDEWSKSQNISLEQNDRTEPPHPPQAHTEHVNVVFTESEKSNDSLKIQKDPPPLIIVNNKIKKDKPIRTSKGYQVVKTNEYLFPSKKKFIELCGCVRWKPSRDYNSSTRETEGFKGLFHTLNATVVPTKSYVSILSLRMCTYGLCRLFWNIGIGIKFYEWAGNLVAQELVIDHHLLDRSEHSLLVLRSPKYPKSKKNMNDEEEVFLKALDEGFSSKNYVRKFPSTLHPKWRAKVTVIEELKYLSSLALDELIDDLKSLVMMKESTDDETLTSESDDEEYAIAVRNFKKGGDPNHLIDDCPKPPRNKDQQAFIRSSWSDIKNDAEDKPNDETRLMAQSSNEVTLNSSYYNDNASSLDNNSMQIEYDNLREISLKIINKNKTLKTKRNLLEKEVLELNEKIKKLERSKEINITCQLCQELNLENTILKETQVKFVKFDKSVNSLREMLNNQKPSSCKICLGFDSSKASKSGTKPMSFVGSSIENATDGSTIKVHESTIPGSVTTVAEKVSEHVFSPPMYLRLDFVITRKKLIHNRIEESKKPSLKLSLKSGLGYVKPSLGYSQNSKAYMMLNKHTMKVKESLNVTFDKSPPPTKLSSLVDDDVGEEEAIRNNTKVVNNNNEEDESIEVEDVVNINESKNHPLDQVIGNLNQRTLRSQAQNHARVETIVYPESDHAGDYVDRKSTGGVCTFMGCCLTSWFAKKQKALASFTTEAEYVSVGKAC